MARGCQLTFFGEMRSWNLSMNRTFGSVIPVSGCELAGLVKKAVFTCLLGTSLSTAVSLEVPSFMSDNMVLQRGREITIWGRAAVGSEVSIEIAGKSGSQTVPQTGDWHVDLEPLPEGGPYELTIRASGSEALSFTNVMVGDVWFASGQSNMEWPVASALDSTAEIAAARYPEMRLYQVDKSEQMTPQWEASGEWLAVTPDSIPRFSAVAYYFGRRLHQELDIPIGLIDSTFGGTPAELWMPREALAKELGETEARVGATLYNGMVHPFIPYPIRGVIWYQGEANVAQAELYRRLFPALIQSWREAWSREDLPFGFVQIAPFRYAGRGREHEAAELRQAQLMVDETIANTGMVVTLDIGNPTDIHPRNKQEVGRRLALWALSEVYDYDVAYSGPVLESEALVEGAIQLHFRHAEKGLITSDGAPVSHLEIAGKDRVFRPATGTIDGSTLVVKSDAVPEPLAVRYAWRHDAEPNLMNLEGFPCSSFRTMNWRDSDGDGFADRGEFAAGTDHLDPSSFFIVQQARKGRFPGSVELVVPAVFGSSYDVYVKSDLSIGPWLFQSTLRNTRSGLETLQILVPLSEQAGSQFFRVSVR